MKRMCVVVAAIGFLLALGGCASMPTWEGMSEAEISEWQKLGINAEAANTFREADLNPENVKGWYAAGITDAETILSWHGEGFNSNEAAEWSQRQFSVREAARWKQEKFSADEAGRWKAAQYDLKDAIRHRAKGLQPIR